MLVSLEMGCNLGLTMNEARLSSTSINPISNCIVNELEGNKGRVNRGQDTINPPIRLVI
jgi:hypothetical protein